MTAVLLLAGPVVGFVAHRLAAGQARAKAELVFEERLTKQVYLLEKQVAAFIEILAGLDAFFASSEAVTREEFARFTQGSLERYPVIRALEWAPRVLDAERAAYEALTRAAGLPESGLTARAADGTLTAAPPQDIHYPVFYAEPLAGNRPALGFDLGSEPIRRRALQAAVATTAAVLSDPLHLVQAADGEAGVLIFQSVQKPAASVAAAAAGGGPGLVVLVLDLEDVIRATLLADAFLDSSSYTFELDDVDVLGASSRLFTHAAAPGAAAAGAWESRRTIEIGGQVWRLTARPRPEFLAGFAAVDSRLVGLGAAVVWELVWVLLIALLNWTKSSVINRQNRILDSVLLSMAEGVIVADNRGRILLINHAAVLMVGLTEAMRANCVGALSSRCRLPDRQTPIPVEDFPLAQALGGGQVRDRVLWIPALVPNESGAWVSANAAPLLSPNGGEHGGVLVLRDITDRKQSLEFSQRMSNAVEKTADSVFITDRSGVIEYVNLAFVETTGFPRDEVLGRTPRLLKSGLNDPEHYRVLWETILRGDVFRGMTINRKKCGEIYYADQTITPMRDLSGCITHFVAVVKDMTDYRQLRQREVEMEIAAKVQQRLYPSEAPPVPGLDIAGEVFSADATCGDYYDFMPVPGDGVGLVVGDVSGHGIGPALVMAETRAYVRSLPLDRHQPGEILSQVNRHLIQDLSGEHFVTLVLVRLDAATGSLAYSSAGHDTCFVLDRSGAVKHELASTGLPLGILDRGDYPTRTETGLQVGDILVLLTDGLCDCRAQAGRFAEMDEFLELIQAHRHEPAAVIIERIHDRVRDLLGGESQADDITLVLVKVLESPADPGSTGNG